MRRQLHMRHHHVRTPLSLAVSAHRDLELHNYQSVLCSLQLTAPMKQVAFQYSSQTKIQFLVIIKGSGMRYDFKTSSINYLLSSFSFNYISPLTCLPLASSHVSRPASLYQLMNCSSERRWKVTFLWVRLHSSALKCVITLPMRTRWKVQQLCSHFLGQVSLLFFSLPINLEF